MINLISSSIREALENPLTYTRNYLGDILDSCIDCVIYLDSDVVVVDDIVKLWETNLTSTRVIGAPKYRHMNLPSTSHIRSGPTRFFPRYFQPEARATSTPGLWSWIW
nr:putative galacturonosyltransferase-like 9 [Quercus suber]